jgi:hypothetical protein
MPGRARSSKGLEEEALKRRLCTNSGMPIEVAELISSFQAGHLEQNGWVKDGERGRNRTYNLLIKSQLLCQLSYAPAKPV